MKFPRLMVLAATGAVLTLAACDRGKPQPKAAAGGELLPRSASDDMLPYDTVRSQASLSPPADAGLYDEPSRSRGSVTATAAAEDDVVSGPEGPAVIDPAPPAPTP
jgi:hypothetical protein